VILSEGWPEFIFHDAGVSPYVERRAEYFADLDFYLLDGDRLVGGCWAARSTGTGPCTTSRAGIPTRWHARSRDTRPASYRTPWS
jgi:hypothetical protein